MPTHVKSLSRHNISDALPDRNSGSNKIGQAALPHKNIHLDLWTDKLLKLKQNWFDKSSSDQQPEYAPNSILDKWKPLLQQSYPSIDKNNWKNFIDNHFYLQYVDDEYELSPLTLNINEDESIVSFLDQLSGRIIERGRTIEDSINKTIEFDTIPYNSIVLK